MSAVAAPPFRDFMSRLKFVWTVPRMPSKVSSAAALPLVPLPLVPLPLVPFCFVLDFAEDFREDPGDFGIYKDLLKRGSLGKRAAFSQLSNFYLLVFITYLFSPIRSRNEPFCF